LNLNEKCNTCGLPSYRCCCVFSSDEEIFKNELKSQYFELTGSHASKVGLSSFIWRELIRARNSEELVKNSVEEAWNEKRQSIAKMALNYKKKYDPILEQKDQEIEHLQNLVKKLQGMLSESEAENEGSTKSARGCSSCGASTGCYCR